MPLLVLDGVTGGPHPSIIPLEPFLFPSTKEKQSLSVHQLLEILKTLAPQASQHMEGPPRVYPLQIETNIPE